MNILISPANSEIFGDLLQLAFTASRTKRQIDGVHIEANTAVKNYYRCYDQQLRDFLFHRWTVLVEQAEIKHRSDLARVEYLSSVDERLEWSKNGLPVDELCTENAIMLHRYLSINSYEFCPQ